MATRRTIRELFYEQLETAVGNYTDVITQEFPEKKEQLPAVVHTDNYVRENLNRASAGSTAILRDNSGTALSERFTTVETAIFTVLVADTDEQAREDAYENIVTYYKKYETGGYDASTLHEDVAWVRVDDASSLDVEDREPMMRADQFDVRLTFERHYDVSETAIDQVDAAVDADNDGTDDTTFTFTS